MHSMSTLHDLTFQDLGLLPWLPHCAAGIFLPGTSFELSLQQHRPQVAYGRPAAVPSSCTGGCGLPASLVAD